VYCLCVNVYCHRMTTQLQLTNIYIIYYIILKIKFPVKDLGMLPLYGGINFGINIVNAYLKSLIKVIQVSENNRLQVSSRTGNYLQNGLSRCPWRLRRRLAAAWLLGSRVRIPLRAWIFHYCVFVCWVGSGICDGLVTCSRGNLPCVNVSACDLETSIIGGLRLICDNALQINKYAKF
jgi:hypothetical protein